MDPSATADDAPLSKVYGALKSIGDISHLRASKLLAAKRPALVPARDTVVENVLGAGKAWWAPYRALVSNSDVVDRLTNSREPSPIA